MAVATVNRTQKKSPMNQYQFLKKIKQNRKGISRQPNLMLGYQTSMSEEHLSSSPQKLDGTNICATHKGELPLVQNSVVMPDSDTAAQNSDIHRYVTIGGATCEQNETFASDTRSSQKIKTSTGKNKRNFKFENKPSTFNICQSSTSAVSSTISSEEPSTDLSK